MERKKIKTIIKEDVVKKIEYLCRRLPDVEWSGTIFYTTNTPIQNLDEFEITVEDLFLHGIGSATYTESEFDANLFDYIEEKDLFNMHKGIIHSHNNMASYFSGTDKNELKENSVHHNIYLSIIVNNRLETTGKLVQRKYPTKMYAYNQYGDRYEIDDDVTDIIVFNEYDCDIEVENVETYQYPDLENMIKITEDRNKKNKPVQRYGFGRGVRYDSFAGIRQQEFTFND